MRKGKWLTSLIVLGSSFAQAEILTVDATWVGGFFADGGKMNDFAHQNYFVGYGTTPGFPRTAERRSFFWFDIPEFAGEVTSASVKLKLLFSTSLVFGLGPGDPPGPEGMETFKMGMLDVPGAGLVDPGLTSGMVTGLFGMMDDFEVSEEKVFLESSPILFPSDVDVALTGAGHTLIEAKRGSDLVLTGWMPTWSFDSRMGPSGAPLEGSELIFGFSDITGPSGPLVPVPTLTIEYTPVPEPTSGALLGLGLLLWRRRRR